MQEPDLSFPHPMLADEDGLLAIGGDLSTERLLLAYSFGIFPWYGDYQPILWWSLDPRSVLWLDDLKVSKSMRSIFRKKKWKVTADQCFDRIISACKTVNRPHQSGTWITHDMQAAYQILHQQGYAHSVEVWERQKLIAGLYGVSLGKIFFGESMFTTVSNASKYGFITLVQTLKARGFTLIDCQQDTSHMRSLGAQTIQREAFLEILRKNMMLADHRGSWSQWFN